MSARWLIHSRDRTFGPWTAVQVRDELRAGRVDPFDMACKEGSTVKRPLVEVDEIFQSSRVQMAELVEVAAESDEQKPTRSTKRAESEPEPTPDPELIETPLANTGTSPPIFGRSSISDRPRPSQFQALAAATRLNPPERAEARKPKQYYVTDSTGRSYGPLSSGEVMKLWYSGRIDSRALVERGSGSKRIRIQKFVEFYQKAAPSGVAFITRATQPLNVRYVHVRSDSASKTLVFAAALLAVGALFFLAMTMRNRVSPRIGKFLPKAKVSEVERFVDLSKIGTFHERTIHRNEVAIDHAPVATASPRVENIPSANVTLGAEAISVRPAKNATKIIKKPPPRKPSRQQQIYRAVPPPQPRANPATASIARAPVVASAATARPVPPPVVKPQPKAPAKAKPFVEGETMTLSGYSFSQSDLLQCDGKCKISMSGPGGAVTAVFFKEALGSSFQGKSIVTMTGIMRKQASGGWSIIVSVAR